MKYVSTRGAWLDAPQPFCAILLEGLAPDGGLAVPERYPAFEFRDVTPFIDALRTIKTPEEIAILKRNGRLSADLVSGRCTGSAFSEDCFLCWRTGAAGFSSSARD